jgi:hypothetical protein
VVPRRNRLGLLEPFALLEKVMSVTFSRLPRFRSIRPSAHPCLKALEDRITPADLLAIAPRLALLPSRSFSCERLPLRRPELGPALAAFAEGKLPGAGKYVSGRLGVYDAVVVATNDEGIAAFMMIHNLDVEGARIVYLGPLFSRHGACLRLFTWYAGLLAAEDLDRPLYLACEIQNPEVLLAIHTLFPRSVFPRIEGGDIPPDTGCAAEVLAERLDHLGALDLATLATRSDETLYTARPGYEPLMDWLRQRGIDPARGDSQLVIVGAGASAWERALFLLELSEGLESLRPGGGGRDRVIAAFRSAVVS